MSESPFERRTEECRAALERADADALVLSPGPNLHYLAGVREEPGERHLLLFLTPTDHGFLVPELSAEAVRDETWVEDLWVWADGEDPAAAVADVLADLGLSDRGDASDRKAGSGREDETDARDASHRRDATGSAPRILLDDRMWTAIAGDVRAAVPGAAFGLASEVLADLRIRKDAAELDRMREAARIADDVSEAVRSLGLAAVGRTERELAREIRDRLERAGGEGLAFETIVGSGPNGARPHHRHGDREIGEGDPVVLDFGTLVGGYPSDQTRTVVFAGDPPNGFREAFEAVREAQRAAVDAVEPGVAAGAVDRAAREVIDEWGYGEAFVHRTGHGVGLEVHEPPYVVEGNDRELEPGMVFSVEPGIYVEGEFGVRIEDLVAVTGDGAERLNDSPRGWEPPD